MTVRNRPFGGLYGADDPEAAQRSAFRNGEVPVAVYGLGKMGLPLAAVFADVCGNVTGADVDPAVVESVNRASSPVEYEPGLDDLVEQVVSTGALSAVTDPAEAADAASLHVVIVPTLLDDRRRPDLSTLRAVAGDVAAGLDPGDLVVVESTVPPGTSGDHLAPLLERESGLPREAFGVACCPERTASGSALRDIRGAYPKVVGGVDDESTRVARLVYETLVDNRVVPVADATTAEAVKLFEGLYRDVNIALANELAGFADELGIDVREAIDVANTQPFCDVHDPGPGVGGHCIPVYPYFAINWLDADAPLLRTARERNDGMPAFVVERLCRGLEAAGVDPGEATVLVLGLTYRAGVPETRHSPGPAISDALADRGAEVRAVDPLLEDAPPDDVPLVPLEDIEEHDPDAAVLATAHEAFEAIDWTALDDLVVVDGRDALDLSATEHEVYTVGRGWE
jgi:UDP-N-acetyl-D-mannosaminuronic acid dehydrogenase